MGHITWEDAVAQREGDVWTESCSLGSCTPCVGDG